MKLAQFALIISMTIQLSTGYHLNEWETLHFELDGRTLPSNNTHNKWLYLETKDYQSRTNQINGFLYQEPAPCCNKHHYSFMNQSGKYYLFNLIVMMIYLMRYGSVHKLKLFYSWIFISYFVSISNGQTPTRAPTRAPTSYCGELIVNVTDAVGFDPNDFDGIYTLNASKTNFDRPVWIDDTNNDTNNVIQYFGSDWIVINTVSLTYLGYTTNSYFPPINDVNIEWYHSDVVGTFHILIECVGSLSPTMLPSSNPTISPTKQPTISPSPAPTLVPTNQPTEPSNDPIIYMNIKISSISNNTIISVIESVNETLHEYLLISRAISYKLTYDTIKTGNDDTIIIIKIEIKALDTEQINVDELEQETENQLNDDFEDDEVTVLNADIVNQNDKNSESDSGIDYMLIIYIVASIFCCIFLLAICLKIYRKYNNKNDNKIPTKSTINESHKSTEAMLIKNADKKESPKKPYEIELEQIGTASGPSDDLEEELIDQMVKTIDGMEGVNRSVKRQKTDIDVSAAVQVVPTKRDENVLKGNEEEKKIATVAVELEHKTPFI